MKVKELLDKFKLTEKEYAHARYNMSRESYFVHEELSYSDIIECSILYFDSDDGVALLKATAEVFSEDGFSIELIDCRYCDIRYQDMRDIIDIFESYEIKANALIDEEIRKEKEKEDE